ncbi:hypothetical protein [Burkholderia ubonensis]|uniref:hypothetical protein n=1 Tax=Burkholderia ubonensis TaxID=101571 RepID=UPI0012F9DEC3|nr:hypothetical protein [Burkholderia ubonensis]
MNRKPNIEIIKNMQPRPATRPRLSLTFYPIKAHQAAAPLAATPQKITIEQKCVAEQHKTCLTLNRDNGHPIAFTHIKPSFGARTLRAYLQKHQSHPITRQQNKQPPYARPIVIWPSTTRFNIDTHSTSATTTKSLNNTYHNIEKSNQSSRLSIQRNDKLI